MIIQTLLGFELNCMAEIMIYILMLLILLKTNVFKGQIPRRCRSKEKAMKENQTN